MNNIYALSFKWYSILYSPWECGWIKDSYPPGVKEIIRPITESNRTQMASKARQSWNLDGWSFFFCLVSMNEFWMCLLYYIYVSGQGLFIDTCLNLVGWFNNKVRHPLLVLSFVNTNWLQWLNKGILYIPLAFIDFYSTKQNLFQKIKFRLEDTVFTNILRFQDLLLFQLAFLLVTKTPSIEISRTNHLVILHKYNRQWLFFLGWSSKHFLLDNPCHYLR